MRLINSYKIKQYLNNAFRLLSNLFSKTVSTCILIYIYVLERTFNYYRGKCILCEELGLFLDVFYLG